MDFEINMLTNSPKTLVYIQITDSQNTQSHFLKMFCANRVCFFLIRSIVSAAVKFNDEACFCTVKIDNVVTQCLLTLKTNWVVS